MKHRIKNILKISGFTIILFTLLFFIIEAAVRMAFPDLVFCGFNRNYLLENKYGTSYGLKSNINGALFGKKMVTDDYGFRIDNSAKTTANPKMRILFLGDSVTFGLGVEAKDTFPYILQNEIADCQAINSSVPGYRMDDYYNVLHYLCGKMDFDGVIVAICLDDFSAISQGFIRHYFNDMAKRRKLIHSPFYRFLIQFNNSIVDFNAILRKHSKTYVLLRNRFMDSSKVIFEAQDFTYSGPQIDEVILRSIQKLNNLASQEKKWILFIVFPFEYQLRKNASNEVLKPQKIINNVTRNASLPVMDIYPYLQASLSDSSLDGSSLYLDAMHFSKKGHHVVSRTIYIELLRRNLLNGVEKVN